MENENEQQPVQEQPVKKEHHALIATLTAVLSVVLAVIIFLVMWYWADTYPDMDDFKQSVSIPGLDEGATPAGIEVFSPTTGTYSGTEYCFIAANMKDGSSRIYVTTSAGEYCGYVTLSLDGEPFEEGINGIALDNYTMWVASGTTIYVDHSSTNNSVINDIITKALENEEHLNPSAAEESDGEDGVEEPNADYTDEVATVADEPTASDVVEDIDGVIVDGEDVEAEDGTEDGQSSDDEDEEEYEFQSVEFTGSFDANCNADFIFFYYGSSNNYLYIGETRASNDSTRKAVTANGDTNYGLLYEYQENNSATYGLYNLSNSYDKDGNSVTVPKINRIFSIPANITGMARTDYGTTNEIALVQDNGYVSSTLSVYDFSSSGVTKSSGRSTYASLFGSNFSYAGVYQTAGTSFTDSLYVYPVDSASLDYTYTIPALANDLAHSNNTYGNDSIYVLFRSAASGSKALVRQATKNVYTLKIREA
ncbi:MAG: hypothetical protein LUE27_08455 [Clostridia bacterium]|nr:hypothetical protein [Clostridia bacterium]